MTVAACDWTALAHPQLAPPYGLVLAADCVWVEKLVAPFVRTLEALAGPTSQVCVEAWRVPWYIYRGMAVARLCCHAGHGGGPIC